MNRVRRSRTWSRTSRRKMTKTFDQRMGVGSRRGPDRIHRDRPGEGPGASSVPGGRRVQGGRVAGRRGVLDQVEEQLLEVRLVVPLEQIRRLALGLEAPLVDDRHPRAELLDL